jgi:hypothetical protein
MGVEIHTDIGDFVWSPDWDVIEQMTQLEDLETTKKYARYLVVLNIQDAVRQALFELRASAEAAGNRSKRERIATKAAENAKKAAIIRLRGMRFFSKPTKARGRGVGKKDAKPRQRRKTTDTRRHKQQILAAMRGLKREPLYRKDVARAIGIGETTLRAWIADIEEEWDDLVAEALPSLED